MLVLAIWLFLLGYVIAWTGKMNLGVSYKPQKDGSIQAVDDKGNTAKTYSLMDAITCGQPSGSPGGVQGPPGPPPDIGGAIRNPLKTASNITGPVAGGLIQQTPQQYRGLYQFAPWLIPPVGGTMLATNRQYRDSLWQQVKRGFCSWTGWC